MSERFEIKPGGSLSLKKEEPSTMTYEQYLFAHILQGLLSDPQRDWTHEQYIQEAQQLTKKALAACH